MITLRKNWDFLAATALGLVAYRWIPAASWDKVTAETVTFLGIQAAAVLPAMIFTAGILKPDGLSIAEVDRLQKALRQQMLFWIVMFGLDVVSAVSIIFGKIVGWSVPIQVPYFNVTWELAPLLSAQVAFWCMLALFRTIPFIRGVLSLLELNGVLIQKAIIQRQNKEASAAATGVVPVDKPENYGRVLHH
jgi:hypothetical protein